MQFVSTLWRFLSLDKPTSSMDLESRVGNIHIRLHDGKLTQVVDRPVMDRRLSSPVNRDVQTQS